MIPYRRPLRCGAPRLLPDHNGAQGDRYREAYRALVAELGPFSALQRLEAGRVAVLWVQLRAALEAWHVAQQARESGRGRRPNAAAVEKLARRAGLADGSYSQALNQLRELVGTHRTPASIADLVARQQGDRRA